MTKEEFKSKWESNDSGGGITFNDIADCAKEWGICSNPCTQQLDYVRYRVLKESNVVDAEEYML